MKTLTIYKDGTHLVHDSNIQIEYTSKEIDRQIDVSKLNDTQIEALALSIEKQMKS